MFLCEKGYWTITSKEKPVTNTARKDQTFLFQFLSLFALNYSYTSWWNCLLLLRTARQCECIDRAFIYLIISLWTRASVPIPFICISHDYLKQFTSPHLDIIEDEALCTKHSSEANKTLNLLETQDVKARGNWFGKNLS